MSSYPLSFDAFDGLLDPVGVSTCNNNVRTGFRQSQGRIVAYPGIPPCNQDCLAVLAWEILVNPMLEF
jgi:hypothetical protein